MCIYEHQYTYIQVNIVFNVDYKQGKRLREYLKTKLTTVIKTCEI